MSDLPIKVLPGETISSCIKNASQKFEKNGIENAHQEARIMMTVVLSCEQSKLISSPDVKLDEPQLARFNGLVTQRLKGKPLFRILGYREFYGRKFDLNKDALEPRPETELLIDHIVKEYAKTQNVRFCEIGVGSGIISITLLLELMQAQGVASDISQGALECTKTNGKKHGVMDRLKLLKSDCFCSYAKTEAEVENGQFDFIVSNPPYIKTKDMASLSREVREHDPIKALDGGIDGLIFYQKICDQAREFIKLGGKLFFETGHDQHKEVISIANKSGWEFISQHQDINGKDRVVVFGKS